MENQPDLMLLTGVVADCSDCGGSQILVPVDRAGEYCCTGCDGAVFLVDAALYADATTARRPAHVG